VFFDITCEPLQGLHCPLVRYFPNETGRASMTGMNKELSANERENFMHNLLAFAKEHKAVHWAGTLDEFLDK